MIIKYQSHLLSLFIKSFILVSVVFFDVIIINISLYTKIF